MSGQDLVNMRRLMVSNQLRTNAVTDVDVLAAMAAVPRERFVTDAQASLCYRDTMVPLGGGRGLNPPIATGRLLNAAQVRRGDRALVVGAGTGYAAAVLAAMGATVTALEVSPELVARARIALDGVAGVTLVEGPLADGWAEGAPYAIVYFDGAVEHVPEAIVAQLAIGGRLVGIVADHGLTRLVEGRRASGGFGMEAFAEVEAALLPGFAPAPAFAF